MDSWLKLRLLFLHPQCDFWIWEVKLWYESDYNHVLDFEAKKKKKLTEIIWMPK